MAGTEPVATVVPLKAPPRTRQRAAKRTRRPRKRKDELIVAPLEAANNDSPLHLDPRSAPVSKRHVAPARALAVAVFGLGLVTAAVGLYLNASFLWKFGRTSEAGLVLAIVGFVTDGAALVLPATVTVLWQRGRRALALAGCTAYAIAVIMTFLTAICFASSNIDDAVAGRDAATAERGVLVDEINRLKAERSRLVFEPADERVVAAAQAARDQECGRVGPYCRQRVAELAAVLRGQAAAARAAAIDATISTSEVRLQTMPALASADPQAEAARAVVAWLSQGRVTASAEDIRMTRIIGIGAVLLMAGLLLAFGAALRHPECKRTTSW